MSEMVEKVACALYEHNMRHVLGKFEIPPRVAKWCDIHEDAKELWRNMARSAIQAMREFTFD